MTTRIASLKGFDNIIAGRDLAKVFKEGHVYSVVEIMGEIIVRDLGEHAVSEFAARGASFPQIMTEGVYCLTKKEYEAQIKSENR